MPQRTNDFQQLVTMIQQALAPTGATVTESFMWEGMREIDVLIESEVCSYQVKIAVEVKKEKRPFDVMDVEQLIGKYKSTDGIPVDKVVAVARSGFTKGAREKADKVGIELITLEEAQQSDWTKLAPQMVKWTIQPFIKRVELVPPVAGKNGKDPLADGRFVCKCHGCDEGSPLQWAEWILRMQVLANNSTLVWLEEKAKQRNCPISVALRYPMQNQAFSFDGKQYSINDLIVHICCANAVSPVKWSSYNLKRRQDVGRSVDHIDATFGEKQVSVLFPNGPKSEKLVLRIDNAPVKNQQISRGIPDETRAVNTLHTQIKPRDMPPACPMAQQESFPAVKKGSSRFDTSKLNVGRNDPCPCKSGKKFKQCCLKKAQ
jgi:restriction endonuclease/SEC-C motif-containing protein